VLSVGLVGAMLQPLVQNWREQPSDSFPFSYYPMFTAQRTKGKRETYLVGLDAHGARRLLPYGCAGPGGHNQVRRQINRSVGAGRADAVCAAVAAHVAGRTRFDDIVTVQVLTGTYDLAAYFSGAREPTSERVRASRPVLREERR